MPVRLRASLDSGRMRPLQTYTETEVMSGPGRPTLLSNGPVYHDVWVVPIGWKPSEDSRLRGDGIDPYPHHLEWVREDDSGWHGWREWLWYDEVPETTWLKNYWQETSVICNS